ncbi:hypothetical protein Dda_0403 [Drechslerella dactyloides]|uniref:Peptide hydrolase n=1 Tax=Drechslerella dactyloides TaxID=74499 RepID=A0AAD6J6A0_DREDA|nr:hypothetical protein Dda_0403 [Drechslerella dactyloides]
MHHPRVRSKVGVMSEQAWVAGMSWGVSSINVARGTSFATTLCSLARDHPQPAAQPPNRSQRTFAMRSPALLLSLFTAAATASHIHPHVAGQPQHQQPIVEHDETDVASSLGVDHTAVRVIELEPGVTKRVTEQEKWNLKRAGVNFMDITDHEESYISIASKRVYKYPSGPQHEAIIKPLLAKLDKSNMQKHLEKFTSFWTRYFRSSSGAESSRWLLSQVNGTAKANPLVSVAPFTHAWGQNSIIAHVPPSAEANVTGVDSAKNISSTRIVIGGQIPPSYLITTPAASVSSPCAHQDSVNLLIPMFLRSPGADDDGSGTVTILEAFRVLVEAALPLKNPVEFHWYSAEEGGLLGSQAIFTKYSELGYKVGAMLQQDMTGYVKKTLDAGQPESVGVITDYVDPGLTAFIKTVIATYCDIPYVETKFVIESEFQYSDNKIHTTEDKIEFLSFDHMLQHAKLTLALALELGMADLE